MLIQSIDQKGRLTAPPPPNQRSITFASDWVTFKSYAPLTYTEICILYIFIKIDPFPTVLTDLPPFSFVFSTLKHESQISVNGRPWYYFGLREIKIVHIVTLISDTLMSSYQLTETLGFF